MLLAPESKLVGAIGDKLLVVKVSLAPAKLESVTIGDSAANPELDTWGVD